MTVERFERHVLQDGPTEELYTAEHSRHISCLNVFVLIHANDLFLYLIQTAKKKKQTLWIT